MRWSAAASFWNVALDQSGNPGRQPLAEGTDFQRAYFLPNDIFSSFLLRKIVPLTFDIFKILEDYLLTSLLSFPVIR
jgi:hypothetical protein